MMKNRPTEKGVDLSSSLPTIIQEEEEEDKMDGERERDGRW